MITGKAHKATILQDGHRNIRVHPRPFAFICVTSFLLCHWQNAAAGEETRMPAQPGPLQAGRGKTHAWDPMFAPVRLPRGSFAVLLEAVLSGEVARSRVPSLTGYEERGARNVTAALVDRGMLTAASHRAPLRLAFPAEVAERWFPNLYAANAGSRL